MLDTLTGLKTIYPSLWQTREPIGTYLSIIQIIKARNKAKGIEGLKIYLKKVSFDNSFFLIIIP